MSLSLKDSFGNWKENVFSQKSPKACSAYKQLMGKTWTAFMHGNGIPNTECPIPPVKHLIVYNIIFYLGTNLNFNGYFIKVKRLMGYVL